MKQVRHQTVKKKLKYQINQLKESNKRKRLGLEWIYMELDGKIRALENNLALMKPRLETDKITCKMVDQGEANVYDFARFENYKRKYHVFRTRLKLLRSFQGKVKTLLG